jgi:hypothetical protein
MRHGSSALLIVSIVISIDTVLKHIIYMAKHERLKPKLLGTSIPSQPLHVYSRKDEVKECMAYD